MKMNSKHMVNNFKVDLYDLVFNKVYIERRVGGN